MSSPSAPSVAIVGAGIGGLVLALALRKLGIHAEVFEQSSELTEIGAAVALSANSTRELDRLGLIDDLARASTEPDELIWRDGRSGQRLNSQPVQQGDAYRGRFGAPYFGIHRASLQKVLSSAHGQQGLHLGHRLTKLDEDKASGQLNVSQPRSGLRHMNGSFSARRSRSHWARRWSASFSPRQGHPTIATR